MSRRVVFGLLSFSLSLAACATPEIASEKHGANHTESAEPSHSSAPRHVGSGAIGVDIQKITLNQAVEIPLMKDGREIATRNAPIIAGRPGLLRVFVTPHDGWAHHPIVARLELGGAHATTIDATLDPIGASNDDDLTSTFNLQLPAEVLFPDTTYSVSLRDAAAGKGEATGPRHPSSGSSPLDARPSKPLVVRLVPVIVAGIVPDRRAASLQVLHDKLMRLYPVPAVQIDVRAPLTWTGSLVEYTANGEDPNGGLLGISTLLEQVQQTDADAAGKIYLGVAAHTRTQTMESPQVFGPGGFGRARGVATIEGLWPDGGEVVPGCDAVCATAEVAAHEIGHVLGLLHTGYGTDPTNDVDPSYPYADGTIGTWGYDVIDRKPVAPSRKDMMSYGVLDLEWISDYHYAKLFDGITTSAD